ncbi:unnamed protein product [Arctia plantaginis]|uniref:trypsin n=1 Tax=Arctia plantaginis TaxID=874455 RepID=A0A8S0Z0G4_ARCPL|nr:unnamed protein product [Arctia plantaginis]CAB3245097.1 unnamed protein product [Arctia plantaginis]
MLSLVFCLALISCVVTAPTIKSLEEIRIVGGEDIEIKDAPYQVSLLSRGTHACGGAIVARDIIVTAAHCVKGARPSQYQVRVGSSYSGKGGKLYPVGDLIWHPAFDFYKMDSDIALLWLSEPLKFSEEVAPIAMADEGEEITDGEETVVTGWGHITESGGLRSMLQMVAVPKVNEKLCIDAYKPAYKITNKMLCAGVPEGGKDACQGDSGGPLVHNNKLAGVVSWGLGCARPDYPGVYAKVSALRRWVDSNISFLRIRHLLRVPV